MTRFRGLLIGIIVAALIATVISLIIGGENAAIIFIVVFAIALGVVGILLWVIASRQGQTTGTGGKLPPMISRRAQESTVYGVLTVAYSNIGITFPDTIKLESTRTVFGRSEQIADVVIPHNQVSNQHFELFVEAGQLFIADLNSTNGTYVNGQRLQPNQPMPVTTNISIMVGDQLIQFNLSPDGAVSFQPSSEPQSSRERRQPVEPEPKTQIPRFEGKYDETIDLSELEQSKPEPLAEEPTTGIPSKPTKKEAMLPDEDTVLIDKSEDADDNSIIFGDVKEEEEEEEEAPLPAPAPELAAPPAPKPTSQVNFKAFAPQSVQPQRRYALVAYAFRQGLDAFVAQDVQKFAPDLGASAPQHTRKKVVAVPYEAKITIVPEADDVIFEPAEMTKTWDEDYLRFPFDFKTSDDFDDDEVWIRLYIKVNGLEVAKMQISCEVRADAPQADALTLPDNPYAQATERGDLSQAVTEAYNDIFISYSSKDRDIALQVASQVEQVLGGNVFLDVNSLRAGDDWQYKISEAIRTAPIFYLLWSENSAGSEHCRYEWEYALTRKCPENMCIGVIRPYYWDDPFPPAPDDLDHLHFERIDVEM